MKHYLPRCGWGYLARRARFAGYKSCRNAPPPPSATPVQAQTVELIDALETLTLTGEIRAQFESELAFRVGGRITERNVDVGDHVVAAQVLAKIDPQEQQGHPSRIWSELPEVGIKPPKMAE